MAEIKVGVNVMVPLKEIDEIDWTLAERDPSRRIKPRLVNYLGTIQRVDGGTVTIWIAGMKRGSRIWAFSTREVENMETYQPGFDYV